jgi:chorismate mutase/prephenate dehydratase
MGAHDDDATLRELRERIELADREILEAFLRRLDAAREVRRHKDERGYAFVDAGRERELLERWLAAARGAVPDETVEELFTAVISLSKREARR